MKNRAQGLLGEEILKPTPTRTLNPLPFGDLEPHRFEDLIRQLAYDLRRWKSLEATGRGGSDSGMDIRAIELVQLNEEAADEEQGTEEAFLERQWVFQCKRQKALPPRRIRKAVEESLKSFTEPPHGFVLAAACDVSKEARDTFREEMVARGIEEFFIWAKGELEDLLFQPKNDRLLFAYFGIALQPKRRSLSTTLRSEITKKKQLTALIGEEEQRTGKLVLMRDPTDERYPYQPKPSEAPARWVLCRALTVRKPGHLIVLQHEHLAATSVDGKQWDAILDYDTMLYMAEGELRAAHAWSIEDRSYSDRSPYVFWNEYIDESQRAFLKVRRAVPLDRVLALDPLGDGFFPVPHILVDFVEKTGPFTVARYRSLERVQFMGGQIDIDVDASNRVRIFPKPLPAEDGPEPAEFDQTGKAGPLTTVTKEKLQGFLTRMSVGGRSTESKKGTDAGESDVDESCLRIRDFQRWRSDVALPVFSAFVLQCRGSGHRARVVVRSVGGSEPNNWGVLEAVELKVKLQTSNYSPSGHIRISCSPNMMVWQTNVSPSAKETSGNYGRSNNDPNVDAVTTKEQLETLVLTILERLGGKFG